MVFVFLSDVHFHGEAACEEVVGVRLTLFWWNNVPCVRVSVRLTLFLPMDNEKDIFRCFVYDFELSQF